MKKSVKIKFWGTRGSLAKPGKCTERYGGNTSCVHITSPGGTSLVIDCGTGANDLGRSLLGASKGAPLKGNILFSHTHWDHIQGFPFFAPVFIPTGEWNVYGPAGLGQSLQKTLAGQMQHTYFPIHLDQMGAKLHFHDLLEGYFEIDDIQITTHYLNHPALTLGYRLRMGDVLVVYSCDHEPYSRLDNSKEIHQLDKAHIEFLSGADLVIHDAQFTDKEYPSRRGWGHSTVEYVSEVGQLAGVKRMALSHHDPQRTDDQMDVVVETVRGQLPPGCTMELFGAVEGATIELEANVEEVRKERVPQFTAVMDKLSFEGSFVLVGVTEPAWVKVLQEALTSDHVRTLQANEGDSIVQMAITEMPGLILLQDTESVDGVKLCKEIRAIDNPHFKKVPIVVVAKKERATEGQEAGVTRWLLAPVTSQYAGALIQSLVMKTSFRWVRAPLPPNEEERLEKIRTLALGPEPEERFDRITRIASSLADIPIALVSMVDRDRQWFKSCLIVQVSGTSRDLSFCAHAILSPDPTIITDTLLDDRFADNPLVIGKERIRFYAGFPIVIDGTSVGTLCLIDTRPRQLPAPVIERLHDLVSILAQEMQTIPKQAAA